MDMSQRGVMNLVGGAAEGREEGRDDGGARRVHQFVIQVLRFGIAPSARQARCCDMVTLKRNLNLPPKHRPILGRHWAELTSEETTVAREKSIMS